MFYLCFPFGFGSTNKESIPETPFRLFAELEFESFDLFANRVIFGLIVGKTITPIGIVVHQLFMFLLEGQDILVNLLDFLLEVINLAPDH